MAVDDVERDVPFTPTFRRNVFRSLCRVLLKFPEAAATELLVTAIQLAKNEPATWTVGDRIKQPLRGAHGLVRLLIYYGGDPHDPLVRNVVLNVVGDASGKLTGFREDVLDARYWRRWLEEQSIGGLPPEIAEMIMLWSWENWCMKSG